MNAYELGALFSPYDGTTTPARVDGALPINVIFEQNYTDPLGVATLSPAALCKSADVPHASAGSSFTVEGTDYRITAIEPDGTGVTVLRLART